MKIMRNILGANIEIELTNEEIAELLKTATPEAPAIPAKDDLEVYLSVRRRYMREQLLHVLDVQGFKYDSEQNAEQIEDCINEIEEHLSHHDDWDIYTEIAERFFDRNKTYEVTVTCQVEDYVRRVRTLQTTVTVEDADDEEDAKQKAVHIFEDTPNPFHVYDFETVDCSLDDDNEEGIEVEFSEVEATDVEEE